MSKFSYYATSQPCPPRELHLLFVNDEAYNRFPVDQRIHRDLISISMMNHTHWSALHTLRLEELPDSRPGKKTTGSLSYATFTSALLGSLERAKRHWKYKLYGSSSTRHDRGLHLTTLRIDGYDPGPSFLLPGQDCFNGTLRVTSDLQRTLEFILECTSEPLDSLHLTNVTMHFSMLKTLASNCTSLHLQNVRYKPDFQGGVEHTWGGVQTSLSRDLESVWVDEWGLTTLFALRLPYHKIRTLHLRIGDSLCEVLRNGIQNLFGKAANSLEEFRYEAYWDERHPGDHAYTCGVEGYLNSCLDFSKLNRLRVVELMVPHKGIGRYSRIAVWMSPEGGKLAKRLYYNSPPGITSGLHGPSTSTTHQLNRESPPFDYGIRLVGFQEVKAEGFYRPYVDIFPYEMNRDVRIDRPYPAGVRHSDLVIKWVRDESLCADVREPVMSRWW